MEYNFKTTEKIFNFINHKKNLIFTLDTLVIEFPSFSKESIRKALSTLSKDKILLRMGGSNSGVYIFHTEREKFINGNLSFVFEKINESKINSKNEEIIKFFTPEYLLFMNGFSHQKPKNKYMVMIEGDINYFNKTKKIIDILGKENVGDFFQSFVKDKMAMDIIVRYYSLLSIDDIKKENHKILSIFNKEYKDHFFIDDRKYSDSEMFTRGLLKILYDKISWSKYNELYDIGKNLSLFVKEKNIF